MIDWNASCYEPLLTHVEERTERVMRDARLYKEHITPEDLKRKILDILRESKNVNYMGIDRDTSLPKCSIRKVLPNSKISLVLILIEDKQRKERKLKTLWTAFDELTPH